LDTHKFRSFALVIGHRLQQRKLIQTNVEEQKNIIKTQNHQKTARNKDSPEKKTTKTRNRKKGKQQSIKTCPVLNILCFVLFLFFFLYFGFLVCCFSVCFRFVFQIPYILCGVRPITLVYKKQKNSFEYFLAQKEKKKQRCMKGGGQANPP